MRNQAIGGLTRRCGWQCTPFSVGPSCLAVARRRAYSSTAAGPSRKVTYLSRYFNPISPSTQAEDAMPGSAEESLEALICGGYITQSSSGVFTLLPSGLRLLNRISAIIDEEMSSIGASRMEMPTLLSNKLWKKSGRDAGMGSELYRLRDRKGSDWILAPTHEEEVTKVVGSVVHSYKHLPVKVYQMTRKHRDEPRPRLGLLRTREFVMKDMYTFDTSVETATIAYRDVQGAYKRIMDRLFPGAWRVAEADTGAMGGKLSHEYHIQDPSGEDDLIVCSNNACGYTANAELATSRPAAEDMPVVSEDVDVRLYASSQDPSFAGKLTVVVSANACPLNQVKLGNRLSSQVQNYPLSQDGAVHWDWKDRPDGPLVRFDSLEIIADNACISLAPEDIESAIVDALLRYSRPPGMSHNEIDQEQVQSTTLSTFFKDVPALTYHDFRLTQNGDKCTHCNGSLQSTKSIEVGHTFLLGERYSSVLGYEFADKPREEVRKDAKTGEEKTVQVQQRKYLQMGCYGLGVTRLLGVLAIHARRNFMDKGSTHAMGFIWPSHLAPFTHVVLHAKKNADSPEAQGQVEQLMSDFGPDARVLVDDRNIALGQKRKEANLLGASEVWIVGGRSNTAERVESFA